MCDVAEIATMVANEFGDPVPGLNGGVEGMTLWAVPWCIVWGKIAGWVVGMRGPMGIVVRRVGGDWGRGCVRLDVNVLLCPLSYSL